MVGWDLICGRLDGSTRGSSYLLQSECLKPQKSSVVLPLEPIANRLWPICLKGVGVIETLCIGK